MKTETEIVKFIPQKPKFKTEDKVFVVYKIIGKSKVADTYIRCPKLDYYEFEGKPELPIPLLIFNGYYEISALVFQYKHFPPSYIHEDYVFNSKEEAEKAAKWYLVDFSPKEWVQIIGDRYKQEGEQGNIYDGCELTIGDINDGTSEIRDYLKEIKKYQGIMEVDRFKLQKMLDECINRPEALDNDNSLLKKLFSQINVLWKESHAS